MYPSSPTILSNEQAGQVRVGKTKRKNSTFFTGENEELKVEVELLESSSYDYV